MWWYFPNISKNHPLLSSPTVPPGSGYHYLSPSLFQQSPWLSLNSKIMWTQIHSFLASFRVTFYCGINLIVSLPTLTPVHPLVAPHSCEDHLAKVKVSTPYHGIKWPQPRVGPFHQWHFSSWNHFLTYWPPLLARQTKTGTKWHNCTWNIFLEKKHIRSSMCTCKATFPQEIMEAALTWPFSGLWL